MVGLSVRERICRIRSRGKVMVLFVCSSNGDMLSSACLFLIAEVDNCMIGKMGVLRVTLLHATKIET